MIEVVLAEALSADDASRQSAEIRIYELLATSETFAVSLISYSLHGPQPHLRQLSLIIVGKYVERSWKLLSAGLKNYVMNFSFQLLLESKSAVQKPGVQILVAVLNKGSRDERQDVLTNFFHFAENKDTVVIFLKCICSVAESVDCFVLEEIFSKSYVIIEKCLTTKQYTQLRYAAKFMRTFCAKISSGRLAGEYEYSDISMEKVCSWIEKSLNLLNTAFTHVTSSENLLIITELYRVFVLMTDAYPDVCETYSKEFFAAITTLLYKILNELMPSMKQNSLIHEMLSGYTSDGDKYDLEILVCQLFLVLNNIGWREIHLNEANLNTFLFLLIEYMQLSASQLEIFETESNEFILYEEDDSNELSVRHIASGLMQNLCKYLRSNFMSVFINIGDQILHQSEQRVVYTESYLWGLGWIGRYLVKFLKKEAKRSKSPKVRQTEDDLAQVNFSASAIHRIMVMVTPTLLYSPSLLLRGRAALLLSHFADFFDSSDDIETVIFACLNLLVSPNITTQMQSCKALGLMLMNIGSSRYDLLKLKQSSTQLLSVLSLSFNQYNEDTMHIVLEVMTALIDIVRGYIDYNCCKMAVDLVFKIWDMFSSDVFVVEVARSMIQSALKYTEYAFAITVDNYVMAMGAMLLKYDEFAVSQSIASVMADVATNPRIFTHPNGVGILLSILLSLTGTCPSVKHCKEECAEALLMIISKADNSRLMAQYVRDDNVQQFILELYTFVYNNLELRLHASSNFVNTVVGLFCHIIIDFAAVVQEDKLVQILHRYVELMQAPEMLASRKTLTFGIVYLFARTADITIALLAQLSNLLDRRIENPFLVIYEHWSELHMTLLHSKYNLSISSLGLIQLIKIFNSNENHFPYASHTFSLVMRTLPRLIDDAFNESHYDISYDNTDQNSGSVSEIESISDNFEEEDVDLAGNWPHSGAGTEGESSPYAPAEMYLSDLVDGNGPDAEGLGFCIGVDEDLVYKPHVNDPLCSVFVQEKLRETINSMRLLSSGEYPAWMRHTTAGEQEQLNALMTAH